MPPDAGTLSLRECAERLGVHYMTAYRYVRTGMLAAVKQGTEWRVAVEDLESFGSDPAGPSGPVARGDAPYSHELCFTQHGRAVDHGTHHNRCSRPLFVRRSLMVCLSIDDPGRNRRRSGHHKARRAGEGLPEVSGVSLGQGPIEHTPSGEVRDSGGSVTGPYRRRRSGREAFRVCFYACAILGDPPR